MLTKTEGVDYLKVCSLVEDTSPIPNPLFLGQRGLSLLLNIRIGKVEKNILVDTGREGKTLLHNMKLFGISPECIDIIFLTHRHYDHTGGLTTLLPYLKANVPIIAHTGLFDLNLGLLDRGVRSYSLSPEKRKKLQEKGCLCLINESFPLMKGVMSSGEIGISNQVENVRVPSYVVKEGKLVEEKKDIPFGDMGVIIKIPNKGLVIISGCSHPGIINTVEHCCQCSGIKKIEGIVGGFHLADSEPETIKWTADEFIRLKVKRVVSGHCTGFEALSYFKERLKEHFQRLHTGMVIEFSA